MDVTVQVRPDQSLLDALISAGVEMIYDCQRSECGLCAAKILKLEGELSTTATSSSATRKNTKTGTCAVASRR
ncbi:2Fe-2S iron-sulfur cluster-binding protein [Rhizobium ruizarguesonis]|uniref:2Fe-2S iron-sulfur cluster-binding protein n=1 Tax=Rhizobium ruizarguesonis TaxID=2081791 RepID=UPI0003FDE351|nr:2Fe-2S iron-sulfur cluster binding domain-containing protein [Rhizobium ruizarguesonis]MBY5851574.1 2Fe-2S iron-sulfur cluster binding domain-containing protein [Rhizobium leguminosarum]QND24208.1 2Fe-2S iron-sulfur cluster binding domain-containing protein [Rhizobium leguminosarum bv. viciae]MBY5873423.1 2Fe-2S iron-sulfur cluster binding domain-containing protein [Rhizobium leguminosarum]MBY5892441.1 2Fe-2S iron-sulfur cluster binding domain-containing protein [Rhizobium leguminosarum]NEH